MSKRDPKKSSFFRMRLSPEDLSRLTSLAEEAGVNRPTLIRSLINNKRLRSVFDKKTVIELKRIGVNLNQITKKINADARHSESELLSENLNDIRRILRDIESKM